MAGFHVWFNVSSMNKILDVEICLYMSISLGKVKNMFTRIDISGNVKIFSCWSQMIPITRRQFPALTNIYAVCLRVETSSWLITNVTYTISVHSKIRAKCLWLQIYALTPWGTGEAALIYRNVQDVFWNVFKYVHLTLAFAVWSSDGRKTVFVIITVTS